MAEIRVGTWNALNAFGDETLSEERLHGALEVVKGMDVDVLAIQEMSARDLQGKGGERERARLEEIAQHMGKLGYNGLFTENTGYRDERNAHYMSIWTRLNALTPEDWDTGLVTYGRRHALQVYVPSMETYVNGVHLDDERPEKRIASIQSFLDTTSTFRHGYEAILMGDCNEMHAADAKGTVPRMIGKVARNWEVSDYYNPANPLQYTLGKVIRVCRMSAGAALAKLEAEGFHDADEQRRPTIGNGATAWQIDHIFGSKDITFRDFEVHDRSARAHSQPLSDHSPISVVAAR